MAVYFKFKSARDFDSISMDGPLISVGTLKEKIYQSKNLGGTDSDLLVTNAQTNEEYTGAMLIPRNTSVLIRQVPGRPCMLEPQPPQGYVCHRCKVPGHFIQHCPKNGDPKYDVKRFKHPTGIPKSMLIATPDGSYALPSGAVAVLRPNEAAFEKEIEGLPSTTRSVGDFPPELHCPLCKEVMKDAVLTSRCCFTSYCDKCIRDHIISKAMCVCGATNILADDLLPNKTLRDTINRIMEAGNSSPENAGSLFQVQDMESARCPQPKVPSPTISASKGEQKPSPAVEETLVPKEIADEGKAVIAPPQTVERTRIAAKAPDVSEATHESMSVKEPASQGSAPLVEEEVQQKMAFGEAGKKKKKKKPRMPSNDLQWKNPQDLAAENYMMPHGPSAYNPYWNGMQSGMEGYGAPFGGAMPYMGMGMGYGMGPLDMPFGGVMHQDPFAAQGYMMPVVPPQRDLAEFGMGMNVPPPIMSREEFEARKADLRRKRESERRGEREFPRDREYGREVSSNVGDVTSMKSKSKSIPQTSNADHHHHRQRPIRASPEPPPLRPSKRKSDHNHHDRDRDYDHDHERDRDRHHNHHHHHRSESSSKPSSETAIKASSTTMTASDKKSKASVFSRISFPEQEAINAAKKRKMSSSSATTEAVPSAHHKSSSNGYYDGYKSSSTAKAIKSSSAAAVDYESSDEDRHFKRKPSRYEPSPPPPTEWEEEPRHSRGSGSGSRERERERKHR